MVRHVLLSAATIVVLFAATALTASPADASLFEGLGHLPAGPSASAAAVSADGSVVVGNALITHPLEDGTAYYTSEAFRWTRSGGMAGLGALGDRNESRATGVSADGAVVVGTCISVGPGWAMMNFEAFRWTQGTMTGLGFPSGQTTTSAVGVSGDGQAVIIYNFGLPGSTWRWSPTSSWESLHVQGRATGVSRDGHVIIGYNYFPQSFDTGQPTYASRWTERDGTLFLDLLPGQNVAYAHDVSDDGSVIVGRNALFPQSSIDPQGQPGPDQAFRWTEALGTVGLGCLPGDNASDALAVSGDGTIVVGWSGMHDLRYKHAFIWTADDGMRDLLEVLCTDYAIDMAGWTLTEAVDISADGRTIVGNGFNPEGHEEAWVAVIPEPATLALVAAGLAVAATGRRRAIHP
jgi:probable HAF family extracellular repeat protein